MKESRESLCRDQPTERLRLFQSLCKLIIADIRYVNSSVAGQSF